MTTTKFAGTCTERACFWRELVLQGSELSQSDMADWEAALMGSASELDGALTALRSLPPTSGMAAFQQRVLFAVEQHKEGLNAFVARYRHRTRALEERNANYERQLATAKAELDPDKRRASMARLQEMKDGGYLKW